MATVTGYTAAKMKAMEDASIVSGTISGGHLVLTKHDTSTIDAGNVVGPTGAQGPAGITNCPMVHTWSLSGTIFVPSGAFGFIPPMAISVPSGTGRGVKLRAVRYGIRAGTSVTFSFQRNGANVTGLAGLTAAITRVTTTLGTSLALTDLDELAPVVTAVSGNPDGLFVSVFLDVTS